MSRRSESFGELWASQHVDSYRHDTKAIEHPDVGTLHVDCDILDTGSDGHRLILYTAAARSATYDRLQRLYERPLGTTVHGQTA